VTVTDAMVDMAQSPLKTWNALRGDSVLPICLIALGFVSAAFNLVRSGGQREAASSPS
jgi:hypothetical protein